MGARGTVYQTVLAHVMRLGTLVVTRFDFETLSLPELWVAA